MTRLAKIVETNVGLIASTLAFGWLVYLIVQIVVKAVESIG